MPGVRPKLKAAAHPKCKKGEGTQEDIPLNRSFLKHRVLVRTGGDKNGVRGTVKEKYRSL